MKVVRLFLFLPIVFAANACFPFSLAVHWQFIHVVKGYDWDNRLEIFLDGQPVVTSDTYKQSAKGFASIDVPPGKHMLELVDFVFYKGEWEKNTVENEYALDASAVKELDLKAGAELDVVFNVAKAKTTIRLTKPKKSVSEETGGIPFTVSWKYDRIAEDHDLENRVVVYIDGKREFESVAIRESHEGTLTFPLPTGRHDLRFQTEALYEGKWEEQIRQFDYAIDGFYELRKYSSRVPASLQLTFDLEAATVVSDFRE